MFLWGENNVQEIFLATRSNITLGTHILTKNFYLCSRYDNLVVVQDSGQVALQNDVALRFKL